MALPAAPPAGGQGGAQPASSAGICSVLINLVELLARENKPHMIDAVKNELQHIADDGELMDRADDSDRRNAVAPISALLKVCGANAKGALAAMRAPLCSILAELAQNSPECQAEAMKLIPQLVDIVRRCKDDTQAITKAIYALSAILRGNPNPAVCEYLLPRAGSPPSDSVGVQAANGCHGQGGVCLVDILVDVVLLGGQAGGETENSPRNNNAAPDGQASPPCSSAPAAARLKAAFLLSCLAEQRHDVRQHLSRNYERDFEQLNEDDDNVRELINTTLKRIHTKKAADDGQPPLALAM